MEILFVTVEIIEDILDILDTDAEEDGGKAGEGLETEADS